MAKHCERNPMARCTYASVSSGITKTTKVAINLTRCIKSCQRFTARDQSRIFADFCCRIVGQGFGASRYNYSYIVIAVGQPDFATQIVPEFSDKITNYVKKITL